MAREVSPLAQAIRNLLDTKGDSLTHKDARPLLVKAGFPVAEEPPRKTPEYEAFLNQYGTAFEAIVEQSGLTLEQMLDGTHTAKINKLAASKIKGFDLKKLKPVLDEYWDRRAYAKERNAFDVTKYNWQRAVKAGKTIGNGHAGKVSRKPETIDDPKARAAKKRGRVVRPVSVAAAPVKKRGGRPSKAAVAADDLAAQTEAMVAIEAMGGVSAARTAIEEKNQQIAALTEEVAELERQIGLVETLRDRLVHDAA